MKNWLIAILIVLAVALSGCTQPAPHQNGQPNMEENYYDEQLVSYISDLNLDGLRLIDCIEDKYVRSYEEKSYADWGSVEELSWGEAWLVKYESEEKAGEYWNFINKKLSDQIFKDYIVFDDELTIGKFPFARQVLYEGVGKNTYKTNYKFQAGKLVLTITTSGTTAKESIEKADFTFNCIMGKMNYPIPERAQRELGISGTYICEEGQIVNSEDLCASDLDCKSRPFAQQNYCNMGKAINEQSPALCANLLNIEDWCYYYVAVVKKDDSICDKVPSLLVKAYCYQEMAILKQDVSFCQKITYDYSGQPDASKDRCVANFAIMEKDISICGTIQKEGEKAGCYQYIAEERNDSSICGQIANSMAKENCYVETAQEIADCDRVGLSPYSKDFCYEQVAIVKKDPSICEKLIDSLNRNNCFVYLASETKNFSLCEKIDESAGGVYGKEECSAFVAEAQKDASICEQIITEGTRQWCYMLVARATEDINLCEKSAGEKRNCYESIAISKQDFTLCEEANDKFKCFPGALNKYRIGYEYDPYSGKFS
jgi:hypothetical protein